MPFLIHPPDLFACHKRIAGKTVSVQIRTVHVHRRDLMVVVGRIIIDSLVCITAGGVKRDLVFSLRDFAAASLLVYGAKDMEKLADARVLRLRRAGVGATFAKRDAEERSPGSPSAPIPRL